MMEQEHLSTEPANRGEGTRPAAASRRMIDKYQWSIEGK